MDLFEEKKGCMDSSWHERLAPEFEKSYIKRLEAFLAHEIASGITVYPPFNLIFNALLQTPYDRTRVVIIGQDPYHGLGQAHGLAFSVPQGIPLPPSLQNIFKELKSDLEVPAPPHGCLISWAKQGVLLLNTTLTVRANEPRSHYGKGWELFTDRIVQLLCVRQDPIAFLLWGKSAQDKFLHIQSPGRTSHHLVLTAAHPSPLSAHSGFFGCRHFSKANDFLKSKGNNPIDWKITEF